MSHAFSCRPCSVGMPACECDAESALTQEKGPDPRLKEWPAGEKSSTLEAAWEPQYNVKTVTGSTRSPSGSASSQQNWGAAWGEERAIRLVAGQKTFPPNALSSRI